MAKRTSKTDKPVDEECESTAKRKDEEAETESESLKSILADIEDWNQTIDEDTNSPFVKDDPQLLGTMKQLKASLLDVSYVLKNLLKHDDTSGPTA